MPYPEALVSTALTNLSRGRTAMASLLETTVHANTSIFYALALDGLTGAVSEFTGLFVRPSAPPGNGGSFWLF